MSIYDRRSGGAFLLCALSVAIALPAAAQDASTLWQSALDTREDVATSLSIDRTVKAEGEASIRVTTSWPSVINLGRVSGIAVDAAVLDYRAAVRCQDLEGAAYLEMWVSLSADGSYFSRGLDNPCQGDTGWQQLSTLFRLEEGQVATDVALNIAIRGVGSVWIDDLRLVARALD